jgi:hypothetical protein
MVSEYMPANESVESRVSTLRDRLASSRGKAEQQFSQFSAQSQVDSAMQSSPSDSLRATLLRVKSSTNKSMDELVPPSFAGKIQAKKPSVA